MGCFCESNHKSVFPYIARQNMTPLVNQRQKVSGFSTILPVENVDKTVDVHVPVINERDYDRSCRRAQQT